MKIRLRNLGDIYNLNGIVDYQEKIRKSRDTMDYRKEIWKSRRYL